MLQRQLLRHRMLFQKRKGNALCKKADHQKQCRILKLFCCDVLPGIHGKRQKVKRNSPDGGRRHGNGGRLIPGAGIFKADIIVPVLQTDRALLPAVIQINPGPAPAPAAAVRFEADATDRNRIIKCEVDSCVRRFCPKSCPIARQIPEILILRSVQGGKRDLHLRILMQQIRSLYSENNQNHRCCQRRCQLP